MNAQANFGGDVIDEKRLLRFHTEINECIPSCILANLDEQKGRIVIKDARDYTPLNPIEICGSLE